MSDIHIQKKEDLSETEFSDVHALWNRVYPAGLKNRFEALIAGHKVLRHYCIKDSCGNVIAWSMVFERNDLPWFSILCAPEWQGAGLGSALLNAMKQDFSVLFGWMIARDDYALENGEPYRSPLPFYLRNGFVVEDDIQSGGIIEAVRIFWKRS